MSSFGPVVNNMLAILEGIRQKGCCLVTRPAIVEIECLFQQIKKTSKRIFEN